MNHSMKPLAFVDESGYVIPNPTFKEESLKHIKGRFVYTPAEFEQAIRDMNRKQDERRMLADSHYGAHARLAPVGYDTIEDVVDELAGQRETVPSMIASPTRKRKTDGKSERLVTPNISPLPETLNKEQQGMNLTPEERDDLRGIDTAEAVQAMFGK